MSGGRRGRDETERVARISREKAAERGATVWGILWSLAVTNETKW